MNYREIKIVFALLLLGLGLLGLTSVAVRNSSMNKQVEVASSLTKEIAKMGYNPIRQLKKRQKKKRFRSAFRKHRSAQKNNSYPIHGERSQLTAFLLCVMLGIFGIHRFYTGQTGWAVLQLFSFGCCGVFVIIDLVLIILNRIGTKDGNDLIPW